MFQTLTKVGKTQNCDRKIFQVTPLAVSKMSQIYLILLHFSRRCVRKFRHAARLGEVGVATFRKRLGSVRQLRDLVSGNTTLVRCDGASQAQVPDIGYVAVARFWVDQWGLTSGEAA